MIDFSGGKDHWSRATLTAVLSFIGLFIAIYAYFMCKFGVLSRSKDMREYHVFEIKKSHVGAYFIVHEGDIEDQWDKIISVGEDTFLGSKSQFPIPRKIEKGWIMKWEML